jgi:hypothetical protein
VLGQQVQAPTCVRVEAKAKAKAGRQLHIISSCRSTHQRPGLVTAKLSFANKPPPLLSPSSLPPLTPAYPQFLN